MIDIFAFSRTPHGMPKKCWVRVVGKFAVWGRSRLNGRDLLVTAVEDPCDLPRRKGKQRQLGQESAGIAVPMIRHASARLAQSLAVVFQVIGGLAVALYEIEDRLLEVLSFGQVFFHCGDQCVPVGGLKRGFAAVERNKGLDNRSKPGVEPAFFPKLSNKAVDPIQRLGARGNGQVKVE